MVISTNQFRAGFTMLELVFALVIISISMLALPTVLLSTAAAQEQTLKEEGILLTTSKIAAILTYPWDRSSSPVVAGLLSTSQVLNTTNGDADFNRIAGTDFRQGHFQDELRRRMTPNAIGFQRGASVVPAGPNAIKLGLEDYNNEVSVIGQVGVADGYSKQYRRTTSISYVADTAPDYNGTTNIQFDFPITSLAAGQTSNIKLVQVATDESDGNGGWTPIILMRSYSTNISEAEFFKRRY